MKRNNVFSRVTLYLVGYSDSSHLETSTIQTDEHHTFAGHPVVYLTSDVFAKRLFSVYGAL